MLFTDSLFLFYFLPATLLLHRLALTRHSSGRPYPTTARLVLLGATLLFYGWRATWWLLPFIASLFFDLLWAHALTRTSRPGLRKLLVLLSVTQNLLILGLLKYAGAMSEVMESFFPYGGEWIPQVFEGNAPASLPPGISFYTFESLSFVIDVYRGVVVPPKNPLDFFGFLAMFPRFVAGPIVRYTQVKAQIQRYSGMRLEKGLYLFVWGLFLKCVFADNFGSLVGLAFGRTTNIAFAEAWVGSAAYMMQLYFDFSGYSLMAIGLGHCLGFEFPENFDRPYLAHSLRDFWRRWHMTLSAWLRDYIYIPLGGNRGSSLRTSLNIFYTMLLGGIWHGAGLTFAAWGAWHGLWLAMERAFFPRGISRPLTLFVVFFGWVLFRAESMSEAGRVYTALFSWPSLEITLPGNAWSWGSCLAGITYCFWGERIERPALLDLKHQYLGVFLFVAALVSAFSRLRIPFLYYQF